MLVGSEVEASGKEVFEVREVHFRGRSSKEWERIESDAQVCSWQLYFSETEDKKTLKGIKNYH